MENHIKHEVVEKIQLVHSVVNSEETKQVFSEPRKSASIACGASVYEVSMQVPTWALQVSNLFFFFSFARRKCVIDNVIYLIHH